MGYGGGRRYGYNRYIRKVFYGAVCPDGNKRSGSRSGFDSESSNNSGIGCLVLLILAVLIPAFLKGCA